MIFTRTAWSCNTHTHPQLVSIGYIFHVGKPKTTSQTSDEQVLRNLVSFREHTLNSKTGLFAKLFSRLYITHHMPICYRYTIKIFRCQIDVNWGVLYHTNYFLPCSNGAPMIYMHAVQLCHVTLEAPRYFTRSHQPSRWCYLISANDLQFSIATERKYI